MKRYWIGAVAPAMALLAACQPTPASESGGEGSDYPTGPITMIVPFAPGGSGDTAARMWSEYASEKLGVPVNVVNVEGASGITGMLQALRAKPDGYTLLETSATTSSALYAFNEDAPGAIDDRTYVVRLTSDPYFFLACEGTDWADLSDALEAAKANPSQFIWGAGAQGSNPMLSQLQLFRAAGVDASKTRMVVFDEGNTPSLQACASGDVQFAAGSASDAITYAATGRVRPLATTAPERVPELQDVPTTAELGYPESNWSSWYGITGPLGLPQSVLRVWHDVFQDVETNPAAASASEKSGLTWSVLPSDEFTQFVMAEYNDLKAIAKETGIGSS